MTVHNIYNQVYGNFVNRELVESIYIYHNIAILCAYECVSVCACECLLCVLVC